MLLSSPTSQSDIHSLFCLQNISVYEYQNHTSISLTRPVDAVQHTAVFYRDASLIQPLMALLTINSLLVFVFLYGTASKMLLSL
jgi:hypothetical protein